MWDKKSPEQYELFGPEGDEKEHYAGALLVGEARVTCFPVRSAAGAFAWITSPLALQRYARDVGNLGGSKMDDVGDAECLAGSKVVVPGRNSVVLEEYAFNVKGAPAAAVALLAGIFPDEDLWQTLGERLVVVSDGIFAHFCATACEVQQRIRIDDESGTVAQGGLFNQENVPSETLFHAVMGERKQGALSKLAVNLKNTPVLQIGGDETIGLGFCTVRLSEGGV
jgi:CRISPR-associated protein Cmr4